MFSVMIKGTTPVPSHQFTSLCEILKSMDEFHSSSGIIRGNYFINF